MKFRKDTKSSLFSGLSYGELAYTEKSPAAFITGVGRSGTHFMATLLSKSAGTAAYHMDDIGDAVGDSFEWYARWYGLPVSQFGFISSRKYLVGKEQMNNKLYIESNPMIAFSIKGLSEEMGSKVVVMVRDPKAVVESHYRKGWYRNLNVDKKGGIPGYQYYLDKPNHSFSRIMPADREEYNMWLQMTTLGKIAWMWRVTYERIFSQLADMPTADYNIVHLNSFKYEQYDQLCQFLGVDKVTSQGFSAVVNDKPGKGMSHEPIEWTSQSRTEYEQQVMPIIETFKKRNIELAIG